MKTERFRSAIGFAAASLLAVLLLFFVFPGAAGAVSVINSGSCGSGVSWTLDSDGALTIGGSGAMTSYSAEGAPWYANRDAIKSVIVEDGVTGVGAYAFYQCAKLAYVSLPETLTSIGTEAFWGCSALQSVTVPDGVTTLGAYAFEDCSALISVTLGTGAKSFPQGLFRNCTGLTALTIPAQVTSVSESFAWGCTGLKSISVKTGSASFSSVGGVLYNKAGTKLVRYPAGKTGASFTIQDGVTEIAPRAFEDCVNLQSVTLPAGMTQVSERAFYGCNSLTAVTLADSVAKIGDYAFDRCTALASVTISPSVTELGAGAFRGCTALANVYGARSVMTIGEDAFLNSKWYDDRPDGMVYVCYVAYSYKGSMPANTDVSLSAATKAIADGAFKNFGNLRSVEIPAGVTKIGKNAFYGASGLSSVSYGGSASQWNAVAIGTGNTYLQSAQRTYGQFDVKYSANGGTNAPETQYKTKGSALTLRDAIPTRPLFTFDKWSGSDGNSYKPGAAYTGDADLTLTAQWKTPPTLSSGSYRYTGTLYKGQTVYYQYTPAATGDYVLYSTGDNDTYATLYNASGAVLATDDDGGENYNFSLCAALTAGQTYYFGVKNLNETCTDQISMRFAQCYPVTYDENGGASPIARQYKISGAALTLRGQQYARYTVTWNAGAGVLSGAASTAYDVTSTGWNTAPDGSGTAYAFGDSYKTNAPLMLYAQWERPVLGTLPTATRENYEFAGWYTQADGGERITAATPAATVTYYAHWTPLMQPPTGVAAAPTAANTLTVSWNAADGATQYNVYRYNGASKTYVYKGTTFASAAKPTQYVDTGLSGGITYYYKVVSVFKDADHTAVSAQSAAANAKCIGAPAAPQNVTAAASGDKAITVSWTAASGATQYNIYRYNGTSKTYVYKGTTFATAEKPTQYADKNLNAGITYYYKVVAVTKEAGLTLVSEKSAAANAKTIGAPAAPAGVAVAPSADKELTVSWNAVPNATQYNIYRYNGASKTYVYKGTTFATAEKPTQYADKNLNPGTTYYYKVVAVTKAAGLTLVSAQSAAANAKCIGAPAAPQNVTAAASADRAITVSWAAASGATQYNVYRYHGASKTYVYKGTTFASAANPTQYTDKNLNPGTTYYYKVVAVTKAAGLTLVSAQSAAANAQAK